MRGRKLPRLSGQALASIQGHIERGPGLLDHVL